MAGCRMPKIRVGFHLLVYITKYLGFANIVDKMNPRTPVDRPTMDSMWVQTLERLYAEWEVQTKLSKEKRESVLKKAMLQKHDGDEKVRLYWEEKAKRYPGMDVEEDYASSFISISGWVVPASATGTDTSYEHDIFEGFDLSMGFDMPNMWEDDGDENDKARLEEEGGEEELGEEDDDDSEDYDGQSAARTGILNDEDDVLQNILGGSGEASTQELALMLPIRAKRRREESSNEEDGKGKR